MAYTVDQGTGDIIIGGFEKGIGDDPYTGLTDMQNVNISSVNSEVGAGFGTTSKFSAPQFSAITMTAFGDGANIYAPTAQLSGIEVGQAVYFTSSSITGVTTTDVFWVYNKGTNGTNTLIGIGNNYANTSGVLVGNTGTAVMYTFNPVFNIRGGINKNYLVTSKTNSRWLLDSNGLVWSDLQTTGTTGSWTYTGNLANTTLFASAKTDAYGNGLSYFQTVTGGGVTLDGWIFVWRNSEIDYMQIETGSARIPTGSLSWVYGWKPSAGTTAQSNYLTNPNNVVNPHEAVITPDGRLCYADAYVIGRFYQTSTGTTFSPTNTASYTFNTYPILPVDDTAISMSYMGSSLYIGGAKNRIYPWDLVSTQYTNPLVLLAENYVTSIVTVNTNLYIFCGQRGNIYISNGAQAQVWKKVPDHLAGVYQPTFTWSAATYNLNRLYFGVFAVLNGTSTPITVYNGLWQIDLNTGALVRVNALGGIVTALAKQEIPSITLTGYGFYIAYSLSGIAITSSTVYTDGTSYVISDAIPVGTLLQPITVQQVEFKLSYPLLSGETIELYAATKLSDAVSNTFTLCGSFSGDGTLISGNTQGMPVQAEQWLFIKARIIGKSSSPSYNRITQIRIIGATAPMTGFSQMQ